MPDVVPAVVPVVVPCVPPISPTRASTLHRTVVLLALSIVPFSATTMSMSPRSISTNWRRAPLLAKGFGGRYPARQANTAPAMAKSAPMILTAPHGPRRTFGISRGVKSSFWVSENMVEQQPVPGRLPRESPFQQIGCLREISEL